MREASSARRRRHGIALGLVIGTLLSATTSIVLGSNPAVDPRQVLIEAMGGTDEIIFVCRQEGLDPHWYANFGYYAEGYERKAYRNRGRLCKLNARTGAVTVLIDAPEGTVRDPQVHYDGRKILFSYRQSGTEYFHLYEIDADGSGLRQLTDGPHNDIEPTYLPDGDIVFCSDRCNRWVNCWLTQVAVLYRCDANGGNLRPLSSNNEHENTPWPLPDGRILYQRWEYIDRSQVHYHHLWTMNPDGTGQMAFYGNMHPGTLMIDAKPVPGTQDVVAIFSPGHGRREHVGDVTIVSPQLGPDEKTAARKITKSSDLRDPYPLSRDSFLAAQKDRLVLLSAQGESWPVYRLPEELVEEKITLHEPRPLRARKAERIIPPRVNPRETTGKLVLSDVYQGRHMEGVKPGDIKKLLVLESLPMPIHYTGGMDPISFGGTFTLERIVGTVPVESDGSAYLELPALRSFFFVALDENDDSVKRMQSFLTVMPGETTSCVGCHEQRTHTPASLSTKNLLALERDPSQATPVADIPDVFDFPRDIQPILDKHCVECHDYDRHQGGVVLTGDHGPMFSHSYYTLTYRKQFVDGRNDPKSNLAPRAIGAVASPLMKKLTGGHYDVQLSPHEIKMVRYWIESGAPYPGTYAALGNGMIGGYYENRQVNTDWEWPETKLASEAIERRCIACHTGDTILPRNLSDEREVSFWRPDPDDPRLRLSRHLAFNLSRPEKSLMLLAPLAEEAGGYGACEGTIFANRDDPDYRKILAMCRAGQAYLGRVKRFDMPGFVPPEPYVREMKRYGILSPETARTAAVDGYHADREYWQSLWYRPPAMISSN